MTGADVARPALQNAGKPSPTGSIEDRDPLRQQVLARNLADVGENSFTALSARHDLAQTYALQGRLPEALELHRATLDARAQLLGQVGKAPGTDGYVTAGEWPAYDLQSDLIVLSACDTGVGRVVQGEGVMGLPYALYVAGNRNTLLSLWPVVDESTTRFMVAFFTRLKAGMPQVKALAETKREFARDAKVGLPLFWAPFVLYGD